MLIVITASSQLWWSLERGGCHFLIFIEHTLEITSTYKHLYTEEVDGRLLGCLSATDCFVCHCHRLSNSSCLRQRSLFAAMSPSPLPDAILWSVRSRHMGCAHGQRDRRSHEPRQPNDPFAHPRPDALVPHPTPPSLPPFRIPHTPMTGTSTVTKH